MIIKWPAAITVVLLLLSSPAAKAQAAGAQDKVASAIASHQYDAALGLLTPLLASHPSSAALWTLKGLALDGEGRTGESLTSFDHALSIDNAFAPALEGASQAAYLHGDPRAAQYVQRLLTISPGNDVAHAMAGALAYLSHDCASSVSHFEQSHTVVYGEARALGEFADCLLKVNQADEAVQVLSRGVQLHPASVQMKYNLGVAYLRDNNAAAAISVLQPLASEKDAELLNLLASAYTRANQPDAASRALETAIEIRPTDEANYLDLAILCLEHQQEKRSVVAATAGIARIPKAASLYLIRGVAYAQLAAYDKAENDFRTAAEIEPDQPHSTIAMSLLYSDQNQLDKEQAVLRTQLKATPGDAVANYLLADLILRGGARPRTPAFEEARTDLARSLAARPDSAEAQILMGKVLEQEADSAGALDHFQAALRIEPENRSALNHEYLLLKKLHRDDDAAEAVAHLKGVLKSELDHDTDAGQVRLGPLSPAAPQNP